MHRRVVGCVVWVVVLCWLGVPSFGRERLGRGLVALQREDGSVFLSWRLLEEDPEDLCFELHRQWTKDSGSEQVLVRGHRPTCYLDTGIKGQAPKGRLVYKLYGRRGKGGDSLGLLGQTAVVLEAKPKPYLRIALNGNYDFQKIGVGDLDGDGEYEFVIKQPDFNTDPFQHPNYWKRSPTTYKLEAYRADGKMLWRYDMGWAIEAGIWYSPWVVYDVDDDGKAEVYCKAGVGDPRDEKGLVTKGPEYLVKLDGSTGEVVARVDWLSREGFSEYNYYCRNFLTVAYLDGVRPALVMQRGTYKLIKSQALDKDLRQLWYWDTTRQKRKYSGQGSHGLISADVDGDGRDELVIGAAVLDDDGKGLWTLGMGHPDVCYVADIDPSHRGLEIFYGFETRQQRDGLCVVDAATGKKLWGHDKPTRHIHAQGMVGDILAEYPGMEVYAGERDLPQRWLYSATGKLIAMYEKGTLSPRPVWWDTDEQKEVVSGGAIRDWGKEPMQRIEGKVVAVMDCIGDYREEVVTSVKGEIRIYTTTIVTPHRKVCLMQDRQYRLGVVAQTMGYYYPAQLGLSAR